MLRTTVFAVLVLVIATRLAAQLGTDSLLAIAATLPDDAAKARYLEDCTNGLPPQAFSDPVGLQQERLALSKRLRAGQQEFTVVLELIGAANLMGQFGLADSLALHYASRIEEVEAAETRVSIYHEAAKSAFFAQQYPQSIRYDSLALQLLLDTPEDFPRDSFAISIYSYLGKAFNASGQFISAVEALNDGLNGLAGLKIKAPKVGEFYTELGIVYSQIGLYDRAVDYFNRNLNSNPDPINQGLTEINIGRNLLLTKNYSQALRRYLRVLELELPAAARASMFPYAYQGSIEAYYRLGQVDSLDYYFRQFTAFQRGNSSLELAGNFIYRQSQFFSELAQDQLAAAELTGRALYQDAIAKNDPAERLMYTELLAELYRRRGDYRQADFFSQELLGLQDSIQSANRNDALLLYYNQFETQEKENQILRLDRERAVAEARRQQYQTAAALLALLLLMGGFFYWQLRKARHKLASQNEMLNQLNATKDRFFSIIAHDLRNPIVALQTAEFQVDTLHARGNTEGVKQTVALVSQTARQLNRLLDNLMQWALGQAGAITLQKETLPLRETIAENLALYAPAAQGKSVALRNEVPPECTVLADHNALQTILRNLIANALKFSPEHGDAAVVVAHRRTGGMDVITVSDSGPGIPANEMAGLFQLHRGKAGSGQRKTGTGLGLILCQEMAELHGGRLEVNSVVGQGTTFSVFLPR
ncbi:ATP-binding protein [Neolewinella lacunae]|uniref:histidine kinase n=1 Tax=Neolewinella lacunae TaxID=1517758 RepID=A0A923T8Y6_9BACT|nr:ATP-binding protein [Neolewinella lacunae]MBC6995034.1 hypothetical protein [Neolewinella lacunae]MDN3633195.1 ATP-binding protein [Neolewinella lacunae]